MERHDDKLPCDDWTHALSTERLLLVRDCLRFTLTDVGEPILAARAVLVARMVDEADNELAARDGALSRWADGRPGPPEIWWDATELERRVHAERLSVRGWTT